MKSLIFGNDQDIEVINILLVLHSRFWVYLFKICMDLKTVQMGSFYYQNNGSNIFFVRLSFLDLSTRSSRQV
jgi:hypothetical protein